MNQKYNIKDKVTFYGVPATVMSDRDEFGQYEILLENGKKEFALEDELLKEENHGKTTVG